MIIRVSSYAKLLEQKVAGVLINTAPTTVMIAEADHSCPEMACGT
jgi:hypothetical protein